MSDNPSDPIMEGLKSGLVDKERYAEFMPLDPMHDLFPEEKHVVRTMQATGDTIRPGTHDGGARIHCMGQPVCTWDTLFRLLGRGVIEKDPDAREHYRLTEAWRA